MSTRATRHAIFALAALTLGCDPAATEDPGVRRSAYCRLVGCGGDPNGAGVVNIEGGGFQIYTTAGQLFLRGFRSLNGRVTVFGELLVGGTLQPFSTNVNGRYNGQGIALRRIAPVQGTWLVIEWLDSNQTVHTSSGLALTYFDLQFYAGTESYRLRLGAPTVENDVHLYDFKYDVNGSNNFNPVCRDLDKVTGTPAAFLADVEFGTVSGLRQNVVGSTSFGCKKGGITTCMLWGYEPTRTAFNGTTGQWEYLNSAHSACIQMKRAAYCAGYGDFQSYTKNGTTIQIADPFVPSINDSTLNAVEAVWTNKGATCLDPNNLRHPELGLPSCASLLPLCSPSASTWWPGGKVASGQL